MGKFSKDKPAPKVAKGQKIAEDVIKKNGGKRDKAGRWDMSEAVQTLTDKNGN